MVLNTLSLNGHQIEAEEDDGFISWHCLQCRKFIAYDYSPYKGERDLYIGFLKESFSKLCVSL